MIHQSAYISLFIQFITGIIHFNATKIEVPKDKEIYKELLDLELKVQIIEFIYYLWLVNNFSSNKDITYTRYFDWMITTPTMLLTLIAYLDLSNTENSDNPKNLNSVIKSNKDIIIKVFVLNFIMLIFGLCGELKILDTKTAVGLGFIPFVLYFKLIYNKFITKNTTTLQIKMYGFFVIIWSLYGVAALLPYYQKNTMYNILDLFAKNFFGVVLVYTVWKNKKKLQIYV